MNSRLRRPRLTKSLYIYIYIYIDTNKQNTYIYIYLYLFIYLYVYMCIYIYIYILMNWYINTLILLIYWFFFVLGSHIERNDVTLRTPSMPGATISTATLRVIRSSTPWLFASGPPNRLCSRAPDSCDSATLRATPGPAPRRLVFFSSTSILLGFWELRNFLRPINASMKEATAKRHLLKDFN